MATRDTILDLRRHRRGPRAPGAGEAEDPRPRRIVDHLRQREKGARPPPRWEPLAGQAAASPV